MYNNYVYRAYKYRIYPNETQKRILMHYFSAYQYIYNYLLDLKIQSDKANTNLSYNVMFAKAQELVNNDKNLSLVSKYALRNILMKLENSWQVAKKRDANKYPRFKSFKYTNLSYTLGSIESQLQFIDNKLYINKIGAMRYSPQRPLPPQVKLANVVISFKRTEEYYVSIVFYGNIEKEDFKSNTSVGLDFSMNRLFVSSDANLQTDANYLHRYKKGQQRLVQQQRKLSNLTYHSNNYAKQYKKLVKEHEHIANQRNDYLHKLSTEIADNYKMVAIETLSMESLKENPVFAKSVNDNGWEYFTQLLDYKMKDRGKKLVKISQWYPSSKTCHVCGYVNNEVTLGVQKWRCPICGTIHDRDYNAAINIREEGRRIASLN